MPVVQGQLRDCPQVACTSIAMEAGKLACEIRGGISERAKHHGVCSVCRRQMNLLVRVPYCKHLKMPVTEFDAGATSKLAVCA